MVFSCSDASEKCSLKAVSVSTVVKVQSKERYLCLPMLTYGTTEHPAVSIFDG